MYNSLILSFPWWTIIEPVYKRFRVYLPAEATFRGYRDINTRNDIRI